MGLVRLGDKVWGVLEWGGVLVCVTVCLCVMLGQCVFITSAVHVVGYWGFCYRWFCRRRGPRLWIPTDSTDTPTYDKIVCVDLGASSLFNRSAKSSCI